MVDNAHLNEGARESHSIKLSDGDRIASDKICHEVFKKNKGKCRQMQIGKVIIVITLFLITTAALWIISSIWI